MREDYVECYGEVTEELLNEYYFKVNTTRIKYMIIMFVIYMLSIIISIISGNNPYDFGNGLIIGWIIMLIFQYISGKKSLKRLLKVNKDHPKYIITKESIKVIYGDEDKRNKITYDVIDTVYESKNMFIVTYNLNTNSLIILIEDKNKEEINSIKEIFISNIDKSKLKFKE